MKTSISKIISAIFFAILISTMLVSCNGNEFNSDESTENAKGIQYGTTSKGTKFVKKSGTSLAKNITAVMKTSMGDITFELYPEKAPLAVENFVTHAKKGYYNNLTFHRVIKGFMIQGGDPQGTGAGGKSIWGDNVSFQDEFDSSLCNFKGALSMANSGPNTNGSQFFIVQAPATGITEQALDSYAKQNNVTYTAEQKAKYMTDGGTPWLDGKHTVFGLVTNGMDVVDKIANVPVGKNDLPIDKVLILSIEINQ